MVALSICPHMRGSTCAFEYCDYWDLKEQSCSLALESHKRVELLNMVLERYKELLLEAKDKDELMDVIKDLNILSVSNTLQ